MNKEEKRHSSELKGIDGWLTFLIFSLVVASPILNIFMLAIEPYNLFSVLETIANLSLFILAGIFLWIKKPYAVKLTKTIFITIFVTNIIFAFMGEYGTIWFNLIVPLLWTLYLYKSERVKNTYKGLTEKKEGYPIWTFLALIYFLFTPIFAVVFSVIALIEIYKKRKTKGLVLSIILLVLSILLFFGIFIGASLESEGYNSLEVLKRSIGLVGKPQPIDSNLNTTYISDKYGFKLTYPSNWFEDYAQRQNVILDLKSPNEVATITIKKYDNVNSLTQQELLDYQLSEEYNQYLEQTGQISSLIIESDTISGIPIAKSTYVETNLPGGIAYKAKVITINIIKDQDTLIGINYVSSPETFNEYLDEAETIIHTFEFITK